MNDVLMKSYADVAAGRVTHAMSVSVVLEWENMTYAEQERPRLALAALQAQAAALLLPSPKLPSDELAPVRLSGPLDVILPFNNDLIDEREFLKNVSDLVGERDSMRVRILPVANGTYCNQKNAGVAAATGEIVIFLDSDVTPEPNWMAAYLAAYEDPHVCVAVGNTYVDISRGDAYSRSMAMTWMFPLRSTTTELTQTKWFYANNAAFRKSTALAYPFSQTPGLKHMPATILVQQLERAGIALWHIGAARCNHPAPNGVSHFVRRAISAGRARVLGNDGPVGFGIVAKWMWAEIREIAWYCKRLMVDGEKVNLRWWQMPVAMSVTVSYYGLRYCGSLATYVAPNLMRSRLDL